MYFGLIVLIIVKLAIRVDQHFHAIYSHTSLRMIATEDDLWSSRDASLSSNFKITKKQSRKMSFRVNTRGMVKLDFSHIPLYGRFQEKVLIANAINRVQKESSSAEVLILFGKSGTGKSALVREALQDFQGTHFRGHGKFESSQLINSPFSALASAFAEIIESMIDQMGKDNQDYASAVSDALGDEAYRLTTLIPELVDLIGERPANEDQEQTAYDYTTFKRLLNLMQCMLRAICSFQIPVILWFDDLNLADNDSLAVFKYLANDLEVGSLLIIGSYEDHSADAIDKISTILAEIDQVKTKLLRLGNLSETSINSMIADVMEMEEEGTKKLAHTVYKRTKGNAFFTIQFLELIQELGLLQYDVETKLWVWDIKAIKEATALFKTVDSSSEKAQCTVKGRLSHLPYTSKIILSTAASLGNSTIDMKVMSWLLKDKKLYAEEAPTRGKSRTLVAAESFMSSMMSSLRGFDSNGDPEHEIRETLVALETIGMVDRIDKNNFRFSHDKIQENAYHLLPDESSRKTIHWKTGQYLKRLLDKRILEDDKLFFVVVDQLNRGFHSGLEEEDHLELSALNLRAAYKARERSAFSCVAQYTSYGLDYLGETKWELHFALAMKLQILATEAALSTGNIENCLMAAETAIENGHTLDQRVPLFTLKIKALAHNGRFEEARDCAISILAELGEKMPSKPRLAALVISIAQSKGSLKDKTEEYILSMPTITEVNTLNVMQFLALTIKLVTDPSLKDHITMMRCRMMQLVLKQGLCKESSVAFTGFGILLATILKDHNDAFRFGNLGLQLQQLMSSSLYDARVAYEFYAFTHHLKQPIRHSLSPLYQSFRKGLRYGTIEDALMSAYFHCQHYLNSGRPLITLSKNLRECLSLFKEYTPSLYLATVGIGQLVENLMGNAPISVVLNGDIMDLEEIMHKVKINNDILALRMILFAQLELTFWFGDHASAQKHLKDISRHVQDNEFSATFAFRRLAFYDSLISIELARTSDKPNVHIKNARACAKKIQKYARDGAVDCMELSEILEAELLTLTPRFSTIEITKSYQKAITSAVQSGAHQNVALANELAGKFHRNAKDDATSMLFLRQAQLSYNEWNAYEKVQDMINKYPELDDKDVSFEPNSSQQESKNNTNDGFIVSSSNGQHTALESRKSL
jgi:predicted ATPase